MKKVKSMKNIKKISALLLALIICFACFSNGTVFAAKGIKALDEELAAKMYSETVTFLENHGYPQYEVSNFALPGFESKHVFSFKSAPPPP